MNTARRLAVVQLQGASRNVPGLITYRPPAEPTESTFELPAWVKETPWYAWLAAAAAVALIWKELKSK